MAIVEVNKNLCKVDPLYQWDINRTLEIHGLSVPNFPEIHFTNDAMEKAIVRQATMDDKGIITTEIPNSLLQKPYNITAYVCIYEGETFKSLYKFIIPIKPRKMPADYTIQDNDGEVYSFNALENKIDNTLVTALERYDEVNTKYNDVNAKYEEVNEKYNTTFALAEELKDDLEEANERLNTAQELYENGMEEIRNCKSDMDQVVSESTEAFNNAENAYTESVEKYNEALEMVENAGENKVVKVDVPTYVTEETDKYIGHGESWSLADWSKNMSFYGITYGKDRFVVVGEHGASWYSLDGITWVRMSGLSDNDYYAVAYGKGRFVAVGVGSKSYYSIDGETWVAMSGLNSIRSQFAVVYGDDRFYTISKNGAVYQSIDGETWSGANAMGIGIDEYRSLAFGNGKFVIVGENGESSSYSLGDETWVNMDSISDFYCNAITYANGRFVAVGKAGESYYSKDEQTWVAMSGLDSSVDYNSVTYGNGRYICVGNNGSIYQSIDGETWTAMEALNTVNNQAVAFGNNRFVAVGTANIIYCKDITEVVNATNTSFEETYKEMNDAVVELYDKSVIIKKTLLFGYTNITIENDNITKDSMLSFYTSIYGVNPKNVTVTPGAVTLTFDAQETDMEVGVKIDG